MAYTPNQVVALIPCLVVHQFPSEEQEDVKATEKEGDERDQLLRYYRNY